MEKRGTPIVYIVDTPEMADFCKEVLHQHCSAIDVRTFSNPVEAMFAFAKARVRPQVVAASLLNMQGLRLAADVKHIDPSVRVLLMSGLEADAISQRIQESDTAPDDVLPKPFTPEDFSSKIQSLIE